jgi:hypothetical protein
MTWGITCPMMTLLMILPQESAEEEYFDGNILIKT